MEQRLAELRPKYAGDTEASATLDALSGEIELHRRYSACYGYEFVVLRCGN